MELDTDTSSLGAFEDSLTPDVVGHNAGGFFGALDDRTLIVRAEVVEAGSPVPEPTTFLLWATTAAGLGLVRWRRRRCR